ncbi:uncharacterized protein EKO05_0002378 [Ascochyta rabiei]|uniref:uncharacterized protein n=1 Tax=Didymella rabiei TaxID=5454 RepID=UPI0021FF0D7D|nr:uncharacterized protein EKO05_0002378 [Ascochyta rabiei]UPX11790.1 hypothetical protein EKO05_0002378 [Ascochyta rabiei]
MSQKSRLFFGETASTTNNNTFTGRYLQCIIHCCILFHSTKVDLPNSIPSHILTSPVADDKSQITALLHRYGAVLASHSIPEVLSIYTDDGVIMAPGYAPACGRDALKAAYERIFSTVKLDIEFEIDEIVVTGEEWAFARTTAEGTKHWLKKGTQEEHRNQELFMLKRDEGEWRIARYCFSSMKPIV